MFSIVVIVVAAVASGVSSVPVPQQYNDIHHDQQQYRTSPVPILKHNYQQLNGGYQYSYETGNGIQAKEHGFIKNKGDKDKEALVQQGTITYMDERGHPITLTYIADENGFQPQGAHLPTPPPSPFAQQTKAVKVVHHPHPQQQQQQVVDEYHRPQVQEQEYDPYK